MCFSIVRFTDPWLAAMICVVLEVGSVLAVSGRPQHLVAVSGPIEAFVQKRGRLPE